MKRKLTVDLGKNGGIAWEDESYMVHAVKMPETDVDILDLFRELRVGNVSRCILEKQFFHMVGNNATSSAKFARHCGVVTGIVISLGFEVEEVSPKKWMPKLGAVPKDKKQRKNFIKGVVQKKYPHLKVTLATSDALGMMMSMD